MKLSNNTVELSKFTESDFAVFSEMRMNPEMMKYVYNPFSLEDCKTRFNVHLEPWSLDSDNWLSFSISLNSTKEKVGDIGFKIVDRENKVGEVGFMIKPGFQGKGIASAALSLIIEFAFLELNFKKLVATCATENTASYSLLEKHGFKREQTLKNHAFINNSYIDDYVYGLENNA